MTDGGRHLQVAVYGGGIALLGRNYALAQVRFHSPSEFTVAGKGFDMEAQLVHRADDGKLAIVFGLPRKREAKTRWSRQH